MLAQLLMQGGGPTLAAMGEDPRKQKGINPLNQTEGGYRPSGGGGFMDSKAMGAVRGGNTAGNPLANAAMEVPMMAKNTGGDINRAIEAVARRWEVDPAALKAFMGK